MVPSPPGGGGWLKINVDAPVTKSHASIVVIARDHLGIPIKMWARVIKLTSPIQAEFETIFWAMLLAKYERWSHVIVEGDAKDCFDALVDPKFLPSWSIHTTIDNILALHRFFFFFAWIRRSSNEVAHKAARFTINSNMSFVFNKDNLSPALSAACKDDYSPCSSFF